MQDLKVSHLWLWRSHEGLLNTDVSKECVASIFKVEIFEEEENDNSGQLVTVFQSNAIAFLLSRNLSTMKMEAKRSSEKSILTRRTRRHIREGGILQGEDV
jgi:hypothetical protein